MNNETLMPIMQNAISKLGNKIAQLEVDLSLSHAQVELQQEQINSLVSELDKFKNEEKEKEETL